MRYTNLFTKTLKEAPKDETSLSTQMLIRAGYIDKVSSGIYTLLPFGLKVFNKITGIVREEINKVGGQEVLMPALTPKDVWEKTDRWENFDALFKLKGNDEKEYALGATHEEIVTPLVKNFVFSYKDLPVAVYQIQTKFRNEKRAKAGLLRGREFSMKDLYSFHTSQADLDKYYETVKEAYFKIFARFGLGDLTHITYASGGAFSKYSHEFQTIIPTGEDHIFVCQNCRVAVNKEIIEEQNTCPECGGNNFSEEKAIEVGNIFKLGARFSIPFDLYFTDSDGNKNEVIMGCYGMGPTRVMGTIAEVYHDEKGLIWPESVAPFRVHLISLGKDEYIIGEAEKLYQELLSKRVEVFFDDREASAGEKFADADLIGIPNRLVVSDKSITAGGVEFKRRKEKDVEILSFNDVVKMFENK